MKDASRDRVYRSLLAAFLRSDLTTAELRQVTNEIHHNPTFAFEFGKLLADVVDSLNAERPDQKLTKRSFSTNDLVEATYFLIQRRRISKRELLSIVESIAPGIHSFERDALPVRQLLEYFFEVASPADRERLHKALSGQISDDPYLRGITKKR